MLEHFGWLSLLGLGAIGLFILACIPHNLRIWRVRRTFSSLPDEVVNKVLRLIEKAAASEPAVTFLRLSEEIHDDEPVLVDSHVGGVPYAEAGDDWPEGTPEGDPAKFLLQVRLDEPTLGDQWQGRLVVAFLRFDLEQPVRSYGSPSVERYIQLEQEEPRRTCIRLQHLNMPAESFDERLPMTPTQLCQSIPEIENVLRPYSHDFEGILTQILRPNVYGYSLDTADIAYVGGDAAFIHNPHEPLCDQCGEQMRFLLLFGEVIPDLPMADGGVYYVYGCDEHPEQVKGFVDSC